MSSRLFTLNPVAAICAGVDADPQRGSRGRAGMHPRDGDDAGVLENEAAEDWGAEDGRNPNTAEVAQVRSDPCGGSRTPPYDAIRFCHIRKANQT